MQLYIVKYPNHNQYAEASPISVEYDYDKIDCCPECGARVSGGYWLRPREVVLTRHRAPDFLYNYNDNAPFVVTERVLEGIKSAGLTGLLVAEEIENVRELCNQLFVSQRFVDMVENLGLTNLHCKQVEQYRSSCWDYMYPEDENV